MDRAGVAAAVEGEAPVDQQLDHPGGLGEILQVADGGSWLRGVILEPEEAGEEVQYIALG